MNSATQILALKMWKLGFIKISLFSFMEPGHYCLAAPCVSAMLSFAHMARALAKGRLDK